MVSLLSITFLEVISPSIALDQTKDKKFYASAAEITLQLPSNSSSPAIQGGTPDHPTTLKIAAFNYDRRSANGAADELLISIWCPTGVVLSPAGNFQQVALITDNAANAQFWDQVYNGTYLSFHVGQPVFPPNTNLFPNVIKVDPNDLEVSAKRSNSFMSSTQSDNFFGSNNHQSGDTFWVNLTKPVQIKLPQFLVGRTSNGVPIYSNQSFTLPPMSLMFKPISDSFDDSFKMDLKWYPGASGYTFTRHGSSVFAAARVVIPNWIGAKVSDYIEGTGHIDWALIDTFTPPST